MNIELLDHREDSFVDCKINGQPYKFKLNGYDATDAVWKQLTQGYKTKEIHEICMVLTEKMKTVDGVFKTEDIVISKPAEHTGNSVSYYDVTISQWTNPDHQEDHPVTVSCNDIIEALGMNYAQANVFKAQWRIAAAKQGKLKKGNNTVYDAEKSCFFSDRVLVQETLKSQR
jgi:hypothetical protein